MMNGIRMVKAGELFSTFIFDGKDCADMGVYNVTSGAVYTMNIEPTFSDNKLEVPAYDGRYYFGTQIPGQQFQFNCFCHDLLTTEYDNFRKAIECFGIPIYTNTKEDMIQAIDNVLNPFI